MALNPMQKKARNSFLLGVTITLIICSLIGVVLYVLMTRQDQKKEAEEGKITYVYRLKNNVMSGQKITQNDVEEITVTEKAVPTGAFASKKKGKTSNGKEVWNDAIFPEGYKSKLDLKAGTILSSDLVYEGKEITEDLRYVEFNMLTLSTTVAEGSYIDIRLTLPNGTDLIVVSEKEVKSILGDTIGLELTEDEILMLESAIVESYIITASKLYVTEYVDPGIQIAEATGEKGTLITYTPTDEAQKLIAAHPNLVNEVKAHLAKRFVESSATRDNINNTKFQYSMEELENLETQLQEEFEKAKAAREAYLSGLTSY